MEERMDFYPPKETLEEWRKQRIEQLPTLENQAFYGVEEDGKLYFYCGRSRFEVSEHFADGGKTAKELLGDAIRYTAGASPASKKSTTQ